MAMMAVPMLTSSSYSSPSSGKELPPSCFFGIPSPSFLHRSPSTAAIKLPSMALVAAAAQVVMVQQHTQQEERGGGGGGAGEEATGTRGGAGAETKWKKKMIPYSRRPSLQYFSGHVKKHRYLPPRNPSHQLGSRHGGGDDREAHAQHSQNTTSMMKIIEKLRGIMEVKELGKSESHIEEEEKPDEMSSPYEGRSAGELFLPKPDTDLFSLGRFWSAPKDEVFPWELRDTTMEKKLEKEERIKRVNAPTLADLIIPPPELRRLRTLGISLQNPVKVGRLGITSNLAHSIMQRWCHSELVKVKCQGPAAENMLKIHRDLERRTGGLVVWRSGSVAVVYRGSDFDIENNVSTSLERKLESFFTHGKPFELSDADVHEVSGITIDPHFESSGMQTKNITAVKQSNDAATNEGNVLVIAQRLRMLNVRPNPFIEIEHEMEIDGILESVGPRYKGWEGMQPAPVDADLLPSEIPDYRPPHRLLPYGVEPKLTNYEETNLRRFIRHIAPHFALGRNTGLQGLAAGILKLWEKSEVVKIGLKKNVRNMNNETMAEELKRLTGGDLLARDEYFITLYRGNDFLPQQVASALAERFIMLSSQKVGEEDGIEIQPKKTPTVGKHGLTENIVGIERKAEESRHFLLAQSLEAKLAIAIRKKEKAQQDLKNLEDIFMPVHQSAEQETITKEEMYVLRKHGLEMSEFLLIGRRGVFDGVIENMHTHWKNRELVKLIVKEMDQERLQRTARMLEYASGGVLVAIVATLKGQAIIMYRGKDYEGSSSLQPHNLLTKKEALKRSVEMRRCVSLLKHIQALEKEINKLKATLLTGFAEKPGELKYEKIEDQIKALKLHVGSGFSVENIGWDLVDNKSCYRSDMICSDIEMAENEDDEDSETDDDDAENYFSQLLDTEGKSTYQISDDVEEVDDDAENYFSQLLDTEGKSTYQISDDVEEVLHQQ